MGQNRNRYSIIRLNKNDNGWGVVNDHSGAIATFIDRLALKMTKEQTNEVAAILNAEANGHLSETEADTIKSRSS